MMIYDSYLWWSIVIIYETFMMKYCVDDNLQQIVLINKYNN